ncbi:ribonuclease H-like domain-containing protein [Iodobacter sp. HSC-16F04]|uniref:Ribonuclease H-like domain-containing protein n=1 Tax=Iodobacter violaceini TaxID=3044271 RepID=A0ABX0KQI5_9NEIS|nr:ribonuclease H family protein [Iodobacter violacea]NHQ86846.1 ribonuclease H-like domain-containing protein [Iodobacter violacea]
MINQDKCSLMTSTNDLLEQTDTIPSFDAVTLMPKLKSTRPFSRPLHRNLLGKLRSVKNNAVVVAAKENSNYPLVESFHLAWCDGGAPDRLQIGGYICSSKKNILVMYSDLAEGSNSVDAEINSVLRVMALAADMGIRKLIIHTDALAVVKFMSGGIPYYKKDGAEKTLSLSLNETVERRNYLLESFDYLYVVKVERSLNELADALCKRMQSVPLRLISMRIAEHGTYWKSVNQGTVISRSPAALNNLDTLIPLCHGTELNRLRMILDGWSNTNFAKRIVNATLMGFNPISNALAESSKAERRVVNLARRLVPPTPVYKALSTAA